MNNLLVSLLLLLVTNVAWAKPFQKIQTAEFKRGADKFKIVAKITGVGVDKQLPGVKVEYNVFRNDKPLEGGSWKSGLIIGGVSSSDAQKKFVVQPLKVGDVQFGWMIDLAPASNTLKQLIVPGTNRYSSFSLETNGPMEWRATGDGKFAGLFWTQEYLTGGTASSVYVPGKVDVLVGGEVPQVGYGKFGGNTSAWPKPFPESPARNFAAYFLGGLAAQDLEMMQATLDQDFVEKEAAGYKSQGAPSTKTEAKELISLLKKYEIPLSTLGSRTRHQ